MGRSRFKLQEKEYPYFITCSVIEGVSLFSDSELARIILESLQFIQQHKGVLVFGYVIMGNHIHAVIQADDLGEVIKSFKSYTAKLIVKSLEARRRLIVLKKLRFHKKKHKTQSEYQLWQEGVHPKQVNSSIKMISMLEYIHNNPVKAGYVDNPIHWRYSSARNYRGETGLIDISLYAG